MFPSATSADHDTSRPSVEITMNFESQSEKLASLPRNLMQWVDPSIWIACRLQTVQKFCHAWDPQWMRWLWHRICLRGIWRPMVTRNIIIMLLSCNWISSRMETMQLILPSMRFSLSCWVSPMLYIRRTNLLRAHHATIANSRMSTILVLTRPCSCYVFLVHNACK